METKLDSVYIQNLQRGREGGGGEGQISVHIPELTEREDGVWMETKLDSVHIQNSQRGREGGGGGAN